MKIYVDKYRIKKGYTLLELSRRSGVAVSHIHNIENGNTTPTLAVM